MIELNYDRPIPSYGTLMTREKFDECVQSGGFMDYDGYGYPSDGKMISKDSTIYPSLWKKRKDKNYKNISHILWLNR